MPSPQRPPLGEHAGGVAQRVMVAVHQPLTRGTLVAALRRRGFRAFPSVHGPGGVAAEARAHAIETIIVDHSVDADDLRSRLPGIRLLVLGSVPASDDGRGARPTDHGADHVPPNVSLDDLTAVLNGERTASQAAARRPIPSRRPRTPPSPITDLTPREREVLRALMSGATSAEIAARLDISTHTVRTHLQNVFAKLGVHTRLEAVAIALRAGLRPSPRSPVPPATEGAS